MSLDRVQGLPGHEAWGGRLEALAGHPGPLWIFGETGTGVSTLGAWLAGTSGRAFLDDADRLSEDDLLAWLDANPRGVLGAHLDPEAPARARAASRCLAFRLPTLEEAPDSVQRCFWTLAREEAVAPPLPPALAALPCPGNLRGLRNRLVRWRLLGQLPEDPAPRLPLDQDDLAANLHALERLLLHRALRRAYGNRLEAAKRMGVSRRHLYLLIARHGDPVRGEAPTHEGPKRLRRSQHSRNPLHP
ncbi:helix-turn-helix domain-containing protein [Mesoterricola sediminis]|uniref:Sigma-54 factor interaction domain-containing protein n=1 Tax=Mesoterricola sediminis TaxID=2927980 RepID=A0AA48H5F4_9BACT|nr:helix-turn-helix domain-containing protein [Mesoterricola sediminis]BDU77731.1 hypothetical protein METESE_26890 [Mesoterricola sediminis]